ncbi:MAG: aspartate carbamoyltransferase catalytic subunit [Parcubacteria group bacterium Gr01-1014_24]|nr:MAG: aspartate carbamoyltransferase catalytic subunit [Parcubacteria group bacterium Gr01-1014_24]
MINVLTGKQFADKSLIEKIFKRARELQDADAKRKAPKLLSGKVVATVFYETSTRTRLSFESGALKLGAGIISIADPKTSSASKGESLEDAIKVISGYSDVIVLRHPENGAAEKAASVSNVPIINAGDGFNEHPTQALYDLYTIEKELGKIDGLKIAFLADLRYQRNVHSLIPIFTLFKNLQLYFIGPKELALPQIYKDQLIRARIKFKELENVDEILPNIDVLYVARVFKERFSDETEYERLKKSFFVDKNTLAKMKKNSIILHVMPRIFEIDKEVDADPRAAYFRQAKNGLYVRMALLLYALGL